VVQGAVAMTPNSEWEDTGIVWAFQGVFDDEKKADAACKDASYFIFPAVLNQELPREDKDAENVRFPRIEEDIPSVEQEGK
jgi:hypothetical protein